MFENDPFSERVSLDQNTRQSKFNQEILQYPLNSGNDGGMTPAGHHIQFEILEQDVGSIKFGEFQKQLVKNVVLIRINKRLQEVTDNEVVVSNDGSVLQFS